MIIHILESKIEVSKQDESEILNWEEANKKLLNGWRLPSSKELNVIFQIKDILKNLEGWYYWTSEKLPEGDLIICQDFSNGKQFPCLKDVENCVRLVRDI